MNKQYDYKQTDIYDRCTQGDPAQCGAARDFLAQFDCGLPVSHRLLRNQADLQSHFLKTVSDTQQFALQI